MKRDLWKRPFDCSDKSQVLQPQQELDVFVKQTCIDQWMTDKSELINSK